MHDVAPIRVIPVAEGYARRRFPQVAHDGQVQCARLFRIVRERRRPQDPIRFGIRFARVERDAAARVPFDIIRRFALADVLPHEIEPEQLIEQEIVFDGIRALLPVGERHDPFARRLSERGGKLLRPVLVFRGKPFLPQCAADNGKALDADERLQRKIDVARKVPRKIVRAELVFGAQPEFFKILHPFFKKRKILLWIRDGIN